MSHPLRVAVLSFWHVHAGDYARSTVQHPDTELVAVWDDDVAQAATSTTFRGVFRRGGWRSPPAARSEAYLFISPFYLSFLAVEQYPDPLQFLPGDDPLDALIRAVSIRQPEFVDPFPGQTWCTPSALQLVVVDGRHRDGPDPT